MKQLTSGEVERVGAADKTQTMANLTLQWIDNPLSKRMLSFVTKRDGNGRRIDKILRSYAGYKVDMSLQDKIASYLFRIFINRIASGFEVSQESIRNQFRINYWRRGLDAVLEGLAWRGVEKPFTASCPFLVVWNFTNACNLHCKHCYQTAGGAPMFDELTTEDALKAVDRMADAGIAYVALSGGEPLVRRDFFQVAERIIDCEMGLSLATNGVLLTKETVKRLEATGCEFIQISLDGLRGIHNSFRGRDCFDRTLQGIRNAVDSKMTIGVSMVVTRFNLDEVKEVIDLTEEMGAHIFMHYNFIPVGRGREIVEQDISPQEREDLLRFMASQNKKRRVTLLSTAPQYARICTGQGLLSLTHFDTYGFRESNYDLGFLADFVGGCGAGRLYCALQPNGDITPCVFIPVKLGNILEDDFIDLWKSSDFLNRSRNRSSFKGNCGVCRFKNICGGCRARAYNYFGDIQESDPGCMMNIDKWKELKEPPKDLGEGIYVQLLQGSNP